jgi:hypothetical protein
LELNLSVRRSAKQLKEIQQEIKKYQERQEVYCHKVRFLEVAQRKNTIFFWGWRAVRGHMDTCMHIFLINLGATCRN